MMITNNHSLPMLLAGMLADPSRLENINITGLSLDSRDVESGYLFLSLAKDNQQREQNLKQALAAELSVVLFDAEQGLSEQETQLLKQAKMLAHPVRQLADKAGEIAARFYGHPSLALTIIAVTGTNGKTSVSQFIAQALEFLGQPCGVIGTLGVGRLADLHYTSMTTPDPISVQKTLADFCQQGIKYAVIEASSHALEQGRLNSITVDVAVLTNLSRDHLDYHGDMAGYAAAKSKLFDFSSVKSAVINSADSLGQTLIKALAERDNVDVVTYDCSGDRNADYQVNDIKLSSNGMSFELNSDLGSAKIDSQLLGQFNSENLLASFASLIAIDIPFEQAVTAIKQCHAVDGRMQSYGGNHQVNVVIDFAHTPDALTQALISLQAHIPAKGDLWCVFGCGGDRDTGKRAEMGRAAEQYADKLVITDDNPRSEEPALIVSDILQGLAKPKSVLIEHDRKLAITHAITHAKEVDIVLIAGKGHEKFQEVQGVKFPFSDSEIVVEMLHAANDDVNTLGDRA